MKVTFCDYDSPTIHSGPTSWIRRLLPELRSQGIEVDVLLISAAPGQGSTELALKRSGIQHSCLDSISHRCCQERVRWILQRLAHSPPDVFVPNLVIPGYYAARWASQAGIPTVGVLHSDDDFHWALVECFGYGDPEFRLSAFVCVSEYLERTVKPRVGGEVAVYRIGYGAPDSPQRVNLPGKMFRLTYVGRFVQEQKRILDVAAACCRVVREIPGVEAVLYGDGPLRREVKRNLAKDVADRIELAGRVEPIELQSRLLGCHSILLLSDYEGLPIALMEAMACGVVPICFDIRSGIGELVKHEKTGLVVRDRSDGVVTAVKRLRDDLDLWRKLSQGARDKARTECSIRASALKWGQLLRELAESAKSRRPLLVPDRLDLPPVHPAFLREDHRVRSRFVRLLYRCPGLRLVQGVYRRIQG